MKNKEWIVFLITTGVAVVCNWILLGPDVLLTNAVWDINIYDTYFIIEKRQLIPLVTTWVFWVGYLFRVVGWRVKSVIANMIFLIFNGLHIVLLTQALILISSLREIPGTTMYPPLSAGITEHPGNIWNVAFRMLIVLQCICVFLLGYIAFRTGCHRKISGYS